MIEILRGLGWIAISASVFANSAPEAVVPNIPLYGLFETEVINSAAYDNPFADGGEKPEQAVLGRIRH